MASKKSKATPKTVTYDCIPISQGKHKLYMFTAPASELWQFLSINSKIEDKNEGYQRVLSTSRVRSIENFIRGGNAIPLSLLVTLEKKHVKQLGSKITIDLVENAGWVIDGQHRLAGAHQAAIAFNIPVVCFIGLSIEDQIQQFITINREAKGVPTSLYYDLLGQLPTKTKPAEVAQAKAADIAQMLKRDESSPFFGRIVVTTSPAKGQMSLTNFVRKVAPLLLDSKGLLHSYSTEEQRGIFANYFLGVRNIFPKEFERQVVGDNYPDRLTTTILAGWA